MGDLTRKKQEADLIKKWEKDINDKLRGKTIMGCRYMTEKEMEDHMWNKKALAIMFTDGTTIYASADDEGNEAGSIFTNIKELPIIPTI